MAERNGAVLVDPAYAVSTGEDAETPERRWPSQDKEYLCECARDHWVIADEAESEWRDVALDDQRFAHGEQWHPMLLQARKDRQCLVIDRSGTPLRQIVNEGRQTRLGIVVSPAGGGATAETAKVIKGLIRNIEQQSSSDIAYTTARTNAVNLGRGYVRILPVYADDFSFEQELRIVPIRNVFSCRMDPRHVMPDGSDANWFFVVTRVSRRAYEDEYGALPPESASWVAAGDSWMTRDEVQVAEYWWREFHPMELVLLEGGMVKPANRLEEGEKARIRDRRTARVPQVWYAKINGYQVLHQSRWQGRYLPIAQLVGECWDIEGKIDYQGLTRRLKDPQRQYNYWESAKAEMIALAPKAPFIGAAQQFEGYQQFWSTANVQPHAYLPYQPIVVGGQLLGPPQRSSVEPPVQAMVQGAQLAADEIKSISGYYDPALGQQSPDQSGVAIGKRQQATNTASFHFSDNERWMIRHVGRILIDALPFYYQGKRAARIVGDDGRGQQVTLNAEYTDPETKQLVLYDVTAGKYDVTVDAGATFATKRQEAVEKLGMLMAAAPDLMRVFGDDFIQSMDFDLAEHAAERLRKTMPPALLQGEPGAEKYQAAQEQLQQLQQLPQLQQGLEQAQKQLMQLQAEFENVSQTNQQLTLALTNKEREQQLEARKLDIEAADKDRDHQEAMMKLDIEMFAAQTDRMKLRADNDRGSSAA
jgi:Phage P22-like portal protein